MSAPWIIVPNPPTVSKTESAEVEPAPKAAPKVDPVAPKRTRKKQTRDTKSSGK